MSVTGRHTKLSLVMYILRFLSSYHIGGWTVRWSNPGGCEIFWNFPYPSWGPLSLVYNGYRISFPGLKSPGRNVYHPPPSSAEVKGRVQLYLYCPSGTLNPVLGRTLPSLPQMDVSPCSTTHLFSLTQHRFSLIEMLHLRACYTFRLVLGHLRACQYKYHNLVSTIRQHTTIQQYCQSILRANLLIFLINVLQNFCPGPKFTNRVQRRIF
jgi:hypothetical protein